MWLSLFHVELFPVDVADAAAAVAALAAALVAGDMSTTNSERTCAERRSTRTRTRPPPSPSLLSFMRQSLTRALGLHSWELCSGGTVVGNQTSGLVYSVFLLLIAILHC